MARKTQVQVRRDTAANWTSANPTLAAGEPGFETDTRQLKIGDGATAWTALSYIAGPTTIFGNLVSLYDNTLTGTAANIDTGANGVGQGSKHLLIVWLAQNTGGGVFDSWGFRFNNDSGGNYDRMTLRGANVTASAVNVLGGTVFSVQAAGAGAAATTFAAGFMLIPSYSVTTSGDKQGVVLNSQTEGTAANCRVEAHGLQWRSTAAITRVTAIPATGNCNTGSRLSIYGIG